MNIGIYNCHWNTFGGGEKAAGTLAQCLSKLGTVHLISHEPFSIPRLEKHLKLNLSRCRSVILSENSGAAASECSRDYDLWVNGSFLSSVRSKAKRSILSVMFPFFGPSLRALWRIFPVKQPAWLQQQCWRDYGFWDSYDLILANSSYTQGWIQEWWGAKSEVLLPPVDLISHAPAQDKKAMILSVGRFFSGGHGKKHDVMIGVFKQLCDRGACGGWEYHLCGGTHPESIHQAYLQRILKMAEGYPIVIHPDIGRSDLEQLYRTASIFWHATGYGENERRRPEVFEHFGITTVEAMSAGCIPVVIAKAGQKAMIKPGVDGYLWNSLEELKAYTTRIINNPADVSSLREAAMKAATSCSGNFCSENFSSILKQTQLLA